MTEITFNVPDELVLAVLEDIAKSQIWHINRDTKDSSTRIDLINIQDHFKTLECANHLIEYFGGEPVDMIRAKVKSGYDLDGTPFDKSIDNCSTVPLKKKKVKSRKKIIGSYRG